MKEVGFINYTPPPKNVGGWVLPGSSPDQYGRIKFMTTKKPSAVHRFMMKWFLGWKWESGN